MLDVASKSKNPMTQIIPNTQAVPQIIGSSPVVINGSNHNWIPSEIMRGVKVIHVGDYSFSAEETGGSDAKLKITLQRDLGSGWEDQSGEVSGLTFTAGQDRRFRVLCKVPYYEGIEAGVLPKYRLLAECPTGQVTLHSAEGQDGVPSGQWKPDYEFEGEEGDGGGSGGGGGGEPIIYYSETFDGFSSPLPTGWSSILSDPTETNSEAKIFFDKLYIRADSTGSVESSEVTNNAFLFPTDSNWEFTVYLGLLLEDVSTGTAIIEILLGNDFVMQFRCWSTAQSGDMRLVIDGQEEISPTPFTWDSSGYTSFDLKLLNINNNLVISYNTGTGYNWLGGEPKIVDDFFSKYSVGNTLTNKINAYSSSSVFQIAQVQGDNYLVISL